MKLNFKTFKKIAEDEHHTTLQAPEGHTIKVAHAPLHPATRGQLASLPMTKAADAAVAKMGNMKPAMAKGGKVTPPPQFSNPTQPNKTPATDMCMADGGEAGSPEDVAAKAEARANAKRDASLAEPSAQSKAIAEPGYTSPKQGSGNPTTPYVSPEQKEQGYGEMVKGGTRAGKVDERLADGGEAEQEPIAINTEMPAIPQELANPNPGSVAHMPSMPQGVNEMTLEQQAAANPDAQPYGTSAQPQTPPEMMPQAAGQEQAAAAPAATPQAAPDPYGFGATQEAFQSGLAKTQTGLLQEATAAQDQAKAQAHLLGQQAGVQAAQASNYQTHYKALEQERQALQQDIQNKHIDPNHYVNSMDTGSRIATAIGLIASGMGGGMMGHGGNLAADFLHKQIDNDISAQKAELGKKENLLSANMRQFGNLRDATDMTRIMQSDILSNRLKQEAAKAAVPGAQAALLKASGDLDMKTAPIVGQMAMRKSLMSGMTQGRVAPETVIRAVVPEGEQAGATKQLKEAQDAVALRDSTLGDFEKLTKLATLGNYATSPLQTSRRIDAIKGAALDKLTKDISGRVTPETVHLIGGIFNTLGSDEKTQAVQKQKLNELLTNGMHYPELKKWGIDVTSMGNRDKMGVSRITKLPPTPPTKR